MVLELLNAYLQGRIGEVWSEIEALDEFGIPMERSEWRDAVSVVAEIMNRSRANIESIAASLPAAGYQFMDFGPDGLEAKHANSRFPVVAPVAGHGNADGLAELERLVAPYGMLPISFKLFLESVGSVDFVGVFSDWVGVENFPLLDPLQVFPVSELVSYHKYLIDETGTLPKDNRGYYLQFAYEENAKEGISGSGLGYGLRLYPRSRIDGDLVNYGYTIGFVNYLRLAFKWCGFPNLEWFQGEVDPRFLALIERMRARLVYV